MTPEKLEKKTTIGLEPQKRCGPAPPSLWAKVAVSTLCPAAALAHLLVQGCFSSDARPGQMSRGVCIDKLQASPSAKRAAAGCDAEEEMSALTCMPAKHLQRDEKTHCQRINA